MQDSIDDNLRIALEALAQIAGFSSWCTGEDCTPYDDGYDEGRRICCNIAQNAIDNIDKSINLQRTLREHRTMQKRLKETGDIVEINGRICWEGNGNPIVE